jgi:hypothetical protein
MAGIGDELQERDTCDVDVMSICGAGDCDEEEVILSFNLLKNLSSKRIHNSIKIYCNRYYD